MAQGYYSCSRCGKIHPKGYVCHVADFLEHLSPLVAVERFVSQSPAGQLIAPKWGVKNDVVTQHIMAELQRRGSWQGKFERKV